MKAFKAEWMQFCQARKILSLCIRCCVILTLPLNIALNIPLTIPLNTTLNIPLNIPLNITLTIPLHVPRGHQIEELAEI